MYIIYNSLFFLVDGVENPTGITHVAADGILNEASVVGM
jgi:hypothetical protein